MYYTFSEKDVVVANRYSKSVLRASVEQLVDNKSIFYFPSFEIVLDFIVLVGLKLLKRTKDM